MGIEPFLVASAIDCVVAQRLARTLCTTCKRRTLIPANVLEDGGFAAAFDLEAYEPSGCGRCANTGYKGRVGLYEVMVVNEEIRKLVLERAPADQIAAAASERHATAARGRFGEGQAGTHVHCRGREGDGIRRICRLRNDEGATTT